MHPLKKVRKKMKKSLYKPLFLGFIMLFCMSCAPKWGCPAERNGGLGIDKKTGDYKVKKKPRSGISTETKKYKRNR